MVEKVERVEREKHLVNILEKSIAYTRYLLFIHYLCV